MSDGDANALLADMLSKKFGLVKNEMDDLRKLPSQLHDALEKIEAANAKITADIKSLTVRVDSLVEKTEAMAARLDSFHQRITHMEEQVKK